MPDPKEINAAIGLTFRKEFRLVVAGGCVADKKTDNENSF
jgi:hypothetical protein